MENQNKTITLSDDNFKAEVLENKSLVLVDFWAAWCGPCKSLAPVIEALATEFDETVKVGKLDVDNNPASASNYQISSIPTLLFFKDGEIVDRAIGAVSKKVLSDKLNALLQTGTVNS